MKILGKSKTPNGVNIQIEDWKKDYPNVFNTVTIAAYPVAKADAFGLFAPKKGQTFRLSIDRWFSSDEEVIYLFDGLKTGKIKLLDLVEHFEHKNYAEIIKEAKC